MLSSEQTGVANISSNKSLVMLAIVSGKFAWTQYKQKIEQTQHFMLNP